MENNLIYLVCTMGLLSFYLTGIIISEDYRVCGFFVGVIITLVLIYIGLKTSKNSRNGR